MVKANPSECVVPLFVPGDRPEWFGKAAASGSDSIVVDLEDAVAPSAKEEARKAFISASLPMEGVMVRINAAGTPWHDDDLVALAHAPVAGVILPKAERVEQIQHLRKHLLPGTAILLLIESARGLVAIRELAQAEGVARLCFGSVDLSADLGCAHTRKALAAARWELILASRAAGIAAPVDGVTMSTTDAGAIEADARYAADLGFSGKACIHPMQIEPARRGLMPSEAEIAWASKIDGHDDGAASIDGMMVDKPVRMRARQVLVRSGLAIRTDS